MKGLYAWTYYIVTVFIKIMYEIKIRSKMKMYTISCNYS